MTKTSVTRMLIVCDLSSVLVRPGPEVLLTDLLGLHRTVEGVLETSYMSARSLPRRHSIMARSDYHSREPG